MPEEALLYLQEHRPLYRGIARIHEDNFHPVRLLRAKNN
jgi:hypothetical protein